MGWPQCNSTLENEKITEVPIWNDHTFHKLGLWLSAICALFALAVSFFLIFMHAIHYSRPHEQRHIIRILFMVPVYAAVSFLSFYYYQHSIYFEVIRDCYEAFAIASFFSLLCAYLAEDLHAQKEYFRTIVPRGWIWPVPWLKRCCGGDRGIWRTPRSGLTWFNVIWVCIFQYCFIRVFMTIVSVITQALKRYCLESLNPAFAHIWVMGIEAVAVSIAMYCLIQFYIQIRLDIAQHKPLLKILAIKLVIFLSFWQTIAISTLTSTGLIKATSKIQTPDIKVGIPAMLLCIEMALFSIFHLFAFAWSPYSLSSKAYISETVPGEPQPKYAGGFLGIKAFVDSMNPWDMIKATGRAARWLIQGRKHRHLDVSYDLSRKASANESVGDGIPKPAGFAADQTAYKGPGRPAHYGGGDPGEGQTLLANPQAMGMSGFRPDTSPYRQPSPYRTDTRTEYAQASGDIGVATTTYDNRPHYQPQAYETYKGQESGITASALPYESAAPYHARTAAPYPTGAAAPYPDRGRPGPGPEPGPGQSERPYYPPPPSARREDNMF